MEKTAVKYDKKLNPVYIVSVDASMIYMNSLKADNSKVEYKVNGAWVEFKDISCREAVINDSLFLRFMESSITRNSKDECKDFINVKFGYNTTYRVNDGIGQVISKHELRQMYYENGVDYTYEKKTKKDVTTDSKTIHYTMLMRSPGKAKKGECIFVKSELYDKAIKYLTMELYDIIKPETDNNHSKTFKIVELSAYQTLITATAIGYINIPWHNILVLKDEEVYSDPMRAVTVSVVDMVYKKEHSVLDFENEHMEELINKKGYTFYAGKVAEGLTQIDKSKEALKKNGIRVNGIYPHKTIEETYTRKECSTEETDNAKIKNILWDGMGLVDESIFPDGMEGFIYCRSHFFKSCLFHGNIQEFFHDYCIDNGLDYSSYTLENVDMFGRKLNLSDIKVVITDKSLKWLKFVDIMGGTEQKAFDYYKDYMGKHNNYFAIVKTAHASKLGDMQLMTYQISNSQPTTDKGILTAVVKNAVDKCNKMKRDDNEYLKYLDDNKNAFNINEVMLELINWNPDFLESEFYRNKKSKDISKLKTNYKWGRLPQEGDNLTIMDNPIAMLLKVFGENPSNEGCFEVVEDGVQCYTTRFKENERLAAYRSPHNSPNNIIHLYNVYPEKLVKYFPNIGKNVIVFNAIKTDTQARLSGHDCDTDSVYVTNQKELVDLARKSYCEYPTIINGISEKGASDYRFNMEDYARMDSQIADAQESIGTSTDTAQLALSYYYDGGMMDDDLKECFIILSVIAQISIDLAKKDFDVDVVSEIGRIRNLPCMKKKVVPKFFAEIKKDRANKTFEDVTVKRLNCPMDIMANIIDNNVIRYADRVNQKPLRNYLNKNINSKGNKRKRDKLIETLKGYNNYVNWINLHKDSMDESTLFALKNRAVDRYLSKANKNLDQQTVRLLVIYAVRESNSDIGATILNFLYRTNKEKFLNCFVKFVKKMKK